MKRQEVFMHKRKWNQNALGVSVMGSRGSGLFFQSGRFLAFPLISHHFYHCDQLIT